MAIVEIEQLAAQLNLTVYEGDSDLLEAKIEAAQAHLERLLGFRIEEEFGGEDQAPIPEPLKEAVLQLAAWWYETREAAGESQRLVPLGFTSIVANFREWAF